MAKSVNAGKKFSSKPSEKVSGGPSGKMQKFSGAGPQASGGTATTKHSGKGAPFPQGGPSGKMHGFSPVKPQKPGVTETSSGSNRSGYAK